MNYDLILNSITIILTVVIAVYAYISPANETQRQHNTRRWFMCISGGIIIVCQILVWNSNSTKETARELLDAQTKKHNDSLNFALQNKTENFIKDNQTVIKTDTYVNKAKEPTLYMAVGNGYQMDYLKDKNQFHFCFHTKDATAYDVNLKVSFVSSFDHKTFIYSGNYQPFKGKIFVEGNGYDAFLPFDTSYHVKHFIAWFRGDFISITNKKQKIPFEEWLDYNIDDDKVWILSEDIKPQVLNAIKNYEK